MELLSTCIPRLSLQDNHSCILFPQVDPLFHKTSAAFDEGGTFGLLLNHLVCKDDECELLLDSTALACSAGTQTEPIESTRHAEVDLADLKGENEKHLDE